MSRVRRVLVVDDNAMNLELATDLLESAGLDVLQATRAPEGINLAKTSKPDLILMDIGLPGMDGYTAVRTLKADVATRAIPTVALTAFAMDADKERAIEAGFDGFITKPIQTRAFVSEVLRFIEAPEESK